MYAIDVCETMDNFYNRADTYKKAIENCKDLAHLYRILSGFIRLTDEWVYVGMILTKFEEARIKVLAYNQVLCNIREIAESKLSELSD